MKKLIFLLVVFLAGFGMVFAGTNPAEPPGVFDTVATNTMAEFDIHESIVIQPMVLVTVYPSSFLAIMAHNSLAIQPQNDVMNMITIFIPALKTDTAANYYLRL